MSKEARREISVGTVYSDSANHERILVVSSIPEHGDKAPYFYSHLIYEYGTEHECIDPLAAGTSTPVNVGPTLSTMNVRQFSEELIMGWEEFHHMHDGTDQQFIQNTVAKFKASIEKTIEL